MKDQKIQQLASPLEIYHKPANRFVASFVGSPRMNFLEGRIERGDRGPVFAVGQRAIPLGSYPFKAQPEPGMPVTFGIRPEHLSISSGGGFAGVTVEVVEPMGSDNLAWCRDGDLGLAVRLAGDVLPATGQSLDLAVDPSRISLFHAQTGERL